VCVGNMRLKMYKIWCWVWRKRLKDITVVRITGWRSALVDRVGYGRERVWFCPFWLK